MKVRFLAYVFCGLLLSACSMAEKISKIEYVGCKRIERETIESYLPIQEGDECDADSINEALKALTETGFFENVDISIKGSVLVINVKEAPIINKISFEGNKKISDQDLNKAIRMKTNETFDPAKVKEIQQGLLDLYRKMGRYNATVEPKIIRLPNDKVNLVFEIDEGNAAGIGKIIFTGNDAFPASDLMDAVYSKVKRWYRFFVTDDIYDPDRMVEDKAAIERFYHEKGYADTKVISATAELSRDKKEFILTFVIDEGPLYTFGKIDVQSHVARLNKKDLQIDFYCKSGERFNARLVEVDTVKIIKKASEHGFACVKVEPQFEKNIKTKIVGMTFHVNESDKIYVSKIIIKGNNRTREHVIRREIDIEEGDAFNQYMVSMAESSLRQTGYFKSVNIDAIQDPSSPDKCYLQVTVDEGSTGEAMVAASYSSQEGIGIDLTYGERNFLGTGKGLSFFLGSGRTMTGRSYEVDPTTGEERTISRKSKFRMFNNVNVSLSDPHVFDKDIDGSVTVFRHQNGRWDSFTTRDLGTTLDISYQLTSKVRQSWEYTVNARKFSDITDYASPIIKYQTMHRDGETVNTKRPGKSSVSSLKHTISYGTSFFTGLRGSFKSGISTTIAGLGGDAKHLKNELFSTYLIPINRKTSVRVECSCGILTKVGSKQPHAADSFVMGLESFRGFDDCGVGPMSETMRFIIFKNALDVAENKVITCRDYIGATKYWKGTVEVTFPLGLPPELQFRGFVFSDFGTLWSPPEQGEKFLKKTGGKVLITSDRKPQLIAEGQTVALPEGAVLIDQVSCNFDNAENNRVVGHRILDSRKIRVSVGFGVSFITPMGPMQFTYAIPIRKEKHDVSYRFLFGMKTTF